MAKTERLTIYAKTYSQSNTYQTLEGGGNEQRTVWAELQGVDVSRESQDDNEVVKEEVEYLVNRRTGIDTSYEFERNDSNPKRYDVKAIQETDEGDKQDVLVRGVAILN